MSSGPQEKPPPCPECGGERVFVDVIGHSRRRLTVFRKPPKLLEQGCLTIGLACTTCGHLRIYVEDPYKLRTPPP